MAVTRRHFIAGLGAAALAGCAAPPPPDGRLRATAQPVSDPAALGLNAVIDLHHGNRVRDFAAARQGSNILAVIHKASEGDWYDPLYAERRAQAEAAGLLWGAYHFGTGEHSGTVQARLFLAAAQPSPETLLALDLELNERSPANSMTLAQAEEFVREILAATGRLPLLYSHPAWADGNPLGRPPRSLGGVIRPASVLAACDLWLADYRTEPELPRAWAGRGWRFWQYAGDGDEGRGGPFRAHARAVQGIDKCDRNLFPGDAARLARYWTAEAGRITAG
jgi:lysozyme